MGRVPCQEQGNGRAPASISQNGIGGWHGDPSLPRGSERPMVLPGYYKRVFSRGPRNRGVASAALAIIKHSWTGAKRAFGLKNNPKFHGFP